MLYSALKLLDEWETIFTRRLEALGEAPNDLFHNEGREQEAESPVFKVGPALMRHKFILEPENSPFRYNRLHKPKRLPNHLYILTPENQDTSLNKTLGMGVCVGCPNYKPMMYYKPTPLFS